MRPVYQAARESKETRAARSREGVKPTRQSMRKTRLAERMAEAAREKRPKKRRVKPTKMERWVPEVTMMWVRPMVRRASVRSEGREERRPSR